MEEGRLAPPVMVNDGARLVHSSFYAPGGPWDLCKLPWLDCHLGHLRLLYVGNWMLLRRWRAAEIAIITVGHASDGREMLEIFFPHEDDDDERPCVLHFERWQCNRIPGWQPGKRCWILDLYEWDSWSETLSIAASWTAFWRRGPIPCRRWWEGPRQDGLPVPLAKQPTPEQLAMRRQINLDMIKQPRSTARPERKKYKRLPNEKEIRRMIDKYKRKKGLL